MPASRAASSSTVIGTCRHGRLKRQSTATHAMTCEPDCVHHWYRSRGQHSRQGTRGCTSASAALAGAVAPASAALRPGRLEAVAVPLAVAVVLRVAVTAAHLLHLAAVILQVIIVRWSLLMSPCRPAKSTSKLGTHPHRLEVTIHVAQLVSFSQTRTDNDHVGGLQ